MTKIKILGSGTANLTPARNAASVLIQKDGRNIVYDFGRGTASQLARLELKQNDVQAIVLSHYHPDHVSDLLPYLHAASWSHIDKRTAPLTIYGQPGIDTFIANFMLPFGDLYQSTEFNIHLKNLVAGEMKIASSSFSLIDLNHAYGISFVENGKKYAILADSDFHDVLISSLKNVEIGIFDASHITEQQIIDLAVKSNAKTLVCSHLYRDLREEVLNNLAKAAGFRGKLIVAEDLMEFEI